MIAEMQEGHRQPVPKVVDISGPIIIDLSNISDEVDGTGYLPNTRSGRCNSKSKAETENNTTNRGHGSSYERRGYLPYDLQEHTSHESTGMTAIPHQNLPFLTTNTDVTNIALEWCPDWSTHKTYQLLEMA